jgi:hypothetical protein
MEVFAKMGERINHPKWGLVYRRVFRGFAWDAKIERDLQSAEASGNVLEFRREGGDLVVLRRWVEGEDVRSFFTGATFIERRDLSRDLFAAIIGQLGERVHGAVHPNNLRQVDGKPVLLDWVANAARLQTVPESAVTYDLWLWQPRIPQDFKAGAWDRVNLLRMAALLEQGPSFWQESLPFPNMVQLCRSWVEDYIPELTAGDSLESKLREVLHYMDSIQPPPPLEIEKLAQLEEHLGAFLKRRGDRMLRSEDEKALREMSGGDASVLLAVALRLRDAERQEAVMETASDFLRAGVYEKGRRSVRSSACRNAERIFLGLGVPHKEAKGLVQQLLGTLGLEDSHTLQNEWVPEIERYLRRHCGKREYSRRQLSKMVKLVARYDLPEKWAELQLRHYLEQHSASMSRSFFGM